ncbi:MAG TPA: APC family permease [Fimbriimonadaceae bacterium]|jgi:amino acid transporter
MSVLTLAKRIFFGKPIATKHAHHQRLSKIFALPVFASDALSSVAYATEATMGVLLLAGTHFMGVTFPISIAIAILIIIVSSSYYQTLHAYPHGGGSYTVASSNLGSFAGRIAGASLLIDYVLTVSVSVTAGVLALVSIFPSIHHYLLLVNVLSVAFIAVINLRGTKESGIVFAIPTYGFVGLMLLMIVVGIIRLPQLHIVPMSDPNIPPPPLEAFGVFLLLKAFANGCTAMTGIEAISNGIQAFKPPEARNASITLTWMAGILAFMFLGSSWLGVQLHILPYLNAHAPGYKTVLALIGERVFGGQSIWLYALQIFTALILILAANTAFADFPRLSSMIARDGFLPRQLASVGDRLVFQNGIVILTLLATTLIIVFKGTTDALIPLYAIGVFTAFTLSQFGMVVHQVKLKKFGTMVVSLLGGLTTGVVAVIIMVTKFSEGGWIVVVAIIFFLFVFSMIHRHYQYLAKELTLTPEDALKPVKTTVLLLVPRVHRGILQAISYAKSMTSDVRALHVTMDPQSAKTVKADWNKFGADLPLVILESPYRSLLDPITEYIDQAVAEDPNSMITVIVPQAVPKYWWQGLLHNNAAIPLKMALASRKNVIITNVRYFLK